MRAFNETLLASPKAHIDEDDRARGWLGFPRASEQQLGALEERLGANLPPSYRQFLAFTNGWQTLGPFIYRLWSTDEVNWFSVRHQDWIDAYRSVGETLVPDETYFIYGPGQDAAMFRTEYLQTALEISDVGDSAILLLNPSVVHDGEWEALFFANWHTGAVRYRSFWDLMTDEYGSLKDLL